MNTPSTSVSPGLGGFLAFFLLAVALWLLMRNMNKRVRRMAYREEQEAAQRAAEAAAAPGERPVDGTAPGEPEGLGDDRSGRAGPTGPTDPTGPTGPTGHGAAGAGGSDLQDRPGA